ncbi:hypothetical protein PPTG_19047 [Phytophthora nicotianae INRA-310]|uniref:Nudix hydrolase domain-containing protein n=1 Tax=Phytophthora nicotianae (strain INRA-310) TaxID=761204 RepID=W2PFR8_PHYN3|nr:hypothetical protein PPTG_19047 [Phytophthora nicotianae INRA-310]ETM99058.1 hypothetical protein PPTG_19047 [Phytophthora nicotianae INRA-310]
MRVLLLFVVIGYLLSYAAASAAIDAGTTGVVKENSEVGLLSYAIAGGDKQVKRSLRLDNHDELAKLDSKDEERVPSGMVDDVVAKVGQSKLNDLIKKNLDEFAGFAAQGKKLLGKSSEATKNWGKLKASVLRGKLKPAYEYADQLSLSTLQQLDEIQKLRKVDIKNGVKGSKKTPDGMRRKFATSNPPKERILPKEEYLVSHVSRDKQRYGKDGSRLLSAGVVTRTNEQGQLQILLISSSNPNKHDFLLPKGGWDKGENIKKAALREVIEEGGVNAQLAHGLGKVKFKEGEDKYTYFAYLMKSNQIYDDWSESIRYRVWVTPDEAIVMLQNRPHMQEVVKRAKAMQNKITAGIKPELNPDLAKVKLD